MCFIVSCLHLSTEYYKVHTYSSGPLGPSCAFYSYTGQLFIHCKLVSSPRLDYVSLRYCDLLYLEALGCLIVVWFSLSCRGVNLDLT